MFTKLLTNTYLFELITTGGEKGSTVHCVPFWVHPYAVYTEVKRKLQKSGIGASILTFYKVK